MATLTIRDLPDRVRDRLRERAARHGRSMEAEVRSLLTEAVAPSVSSDDVRAFETAIDAAQQAFASYRNAAVLASEELIAERRLEAWRETVEGYRASGEAGRVG